MRRTYLPTSKRPTFDADAASVMSAYHPCYIPCSVPIKELD